VVSVLARSRAFPRPFYLRATAFPTKKFRDEKQPNNVPQKNPGKRASNVRVRQARVTTWLCLWLLSGILDGENRGPPLFRRDRPSEPRPQGRARAKMPLEECPERLWHPGTLALSTAVEPRRHGPWERSPMGNSDVLRSTAPHFWQKSRTTWDLYIT
jgi:hypothetical protein